MTPLLYFIKSRLKPLYILMRFIYKYRVVIVKSDNIRELSSINAQLKNYVDILTFFIQEFPNNQFLNIKDKSHSSKFEDLILLHILNFKRKGFFIEIGAGNGVTGSNTLLLEDLYGWTGLLVEPAKKFHASLFRNRPNALKVTDPIFEKSGSFVDFQETTITTLSTIKEFLEKDKNFRNRKVKSSYKLKTLSLNDLFSLFDVPKKIDFLSLDTEGSEFMILKSFNFKAYKISVICVEHNYTDNRDKIFKLLTNNGFERKYDQVSGINDFYVNEELQL